MLFNDVSKVICEKITHPESVLFENLMVFVVLGQVLPHKLNE